MYSSFSLCGIGCVDSTVRIVQIIDERGSHSVSKELNKCTGVFAIFVSRVEGTKWTTLSVKVISGLYLPKAKQEKQGAVVDPYVRVSVHGHPSVSGLLICDVLLMVTNTAIELGRQSSAARIMFRRWF